MDDGSANSQRQLWQEYEQRTGKRAGDLYKHPCPEGLEYVWGWFAELSAGRSGSGFGSNPLSWQDIDAWGRITGTAPDLFELRCLRALDGAWFAYAAEVKRSKPTGGK